MLRLAVLEFVELSMSIDPVLFLLNQGMLRASSNRIIGSIVLLLHSQKRLKFL